MTGKDPHFHLNVLQTAKLRIKVHTKVLETGQSFHGWMKEHGINCDPKKLAHPQPWRISYGMLHRIASALGYKPDKLYKELSL